MLYKFLTASAALAAVDAVHVNSPKAGGDKSLPGFADAQEFDPPPGSVLGEANVDENFETCFDVKFSFF